MTLRNLYPDRIEPGQSAAIEGAAGALVQGEFAWHPDGWQILLNRLSHDEAVRIAAAAQKIMGGGDGSPSNIHEYVAMLLATYGLEEVMAEVTRQWRMNL